MTALRFGGLPHFGALAFVLAGAACSSSTETPSEQIRIAPGAVHSESVGSSFTSRAPLDASGNLDWNAVAAACKTLQDVGTVSETEVYFACGDNGLLHVTPNAMETWTAPSGKGIYYVKAASQYDVRAITCKDVYHRGFFGDWSNDGTVGSDTTGCATTLATGGGGWFTGVWHPVPEYGELWRLENGTWTGQTSKYNFSLDGAFFKLVAISQDEVIVPVTSPNLILVHAKFDFFDDWQIVNQTRLGGEGAWRASDTGVVYVSSGFDGIFSSKGNDVYTREWAAPEGVVSEIWGRSGGEIYAVGQRGIFASSTGNGQWTETPMANGEDLNFIWPWNGKLVVASEYHMYSVP